MIFIRFVFLCFALLLFSSNSYSQKTFTIGQEQFLLNGKPYVIRCGEVHFARIPKAYWRHRLQMAKAMGLNAVCAYLFWNYHEPQPGTFNWSENADAAAFCKMAQEEGLLVLLRPGPYSCAEWEMGGLPWWLLKQKDIQLRSQHPYFMERSRSYLKEVGRVLAPLQITNGGPIVMVQVENEYGFYGNDSEYVGKLYDHMKEAGFNVPLFTCNPSYRLQKEAREGLFTVVNFGNNPEPAFKALRQVRPTGPLMCGEYYPGWFDSWGAKHHTGAIGRVVSEIKYMLDNKASFSIYMAHGGTTFGQWTGANNPPYLPQTSSYDYDAPISEAGWDTPKFYELRNLFAQYLQEGENLPQVPVRNKVITIPSFRTTTAASLFDNLPSPILDNRPQNMEAYNQGFGAILYRTKLNSNAKEVELYLKDVHDFAQVFLNGKKLAILDRRKNANKCELPSIKKGDVLDVLVEAMGRVNFGESMHDRKGISESVTLIHPDGTESTPDKWQVYPIRLSNDAVMPGLQFNKSTKSSSPAFHKAIFTLTETGDTFLDVSTWGKGLVWINGHCLGRFWNIGPTQTMYVPGPWLKKGRNEMVVLDYIGPTDNKLTGLKEPILDVLTEKSDIKKHRKEEQSIDLSNQQPVYQGTFSMGKEWQFVRFDASEGRYFCIEALNAQRPDDPYTTIAELYLFDEDGKEISRKKWKVLYADSEEIYGQDGKADNVFDLQNTSIWHTQWQDASPKHPHTLVIDLGASYKISELKYLPRQDQSTGHIKDYKVYLSRTNFKGL